MMAARQAARVLVSAAAVVVCSVGGLAQPAEIRLFCSNALRAVVEGAREDFERTSGIRLVPEFSATAALRQRILDGALFDVAILTSEVVDELVRAGRVAPSSRVELARTGIGVGYRGGARRPDVRTPAAVKQALLDAASIVYAREGASRPHIDRMLAALDLMEALGAKTSLVGPGQAPQAVGAGQAELVITLISEILPVPGVELAGPLPDQFQSHVVFAAAASRADSPAVRAFVAFLAGPRVTALYAKHGMERR